MIGKPEGSALAKLNVLNFHPDFASGISARDANSLAGVTPKIRDRLAAAGFIRMETVKPAGRGRPSVRIFVLHTDISGMTEEFQAAFWGWKPKKNSKMEKMLVEAAAVAQALVDSEEEVIEAEAKVIILDERRQLAAGKIPLQLGSGTLRNKNPVALAK